MAGKRRRRPEVQLNALYEIDYLTLARLFLAQREWAEALGLLQHLQEWVQPRGRAGSLLEITLLQAKAYYHQGDTERGIITLSRVLASAEPEGYVRLFLDEGPAGFTKERQAE